MRTDFPDNDPKAIWQNQPAERPILTPEQIQRKARELNTKTRGQLLGSVSVLLILATLYGFGIKQYPALRPLFALALSWSLAAVYFLNRGMWRAAMPGDAASSTGLESYRREVKRRRDLLSRALLWSFGPLFWLSCRWPAEPGVYSRMHCRSSLSPSFGSPPISSSGCGNSGAYSARSRNWTILKWRTEHNATMAALDYPAVYR